MEYLKTYEQFQYTDYDLLNEGFFEKFGKFVSKPFRKAVMAYLKNKTDSEKLDILVKLYKHLNGLSSGAEGVAVLVAYLASLGLKIAFPNSVTISLYWLIWFIWMTTMLVKYPYKDEVMNIVREIKDDHVRNFLTKAVASDKMFEFDPFGEDFSSGERGEEPKDIITKRVDTITEFKADLYDIILTTDNLEDGMANDIRNAFADYIHNLDILIYSLRFCDMEKQGNSLILKNLKIPIINNKIKKIKNKTIVLHGTHLIAGRHFRRSAFSKEFVVTIRKSQEA